MLAGQASAQQPFTLKGTVKGLQNGVLYLSYEGPAARVKDSATLQNGTFQFSGRLNIPSVGYLMLKEDTRNENNSTMVVLEPDVTADAQLEYGQFRKAVFKGSPLNRQYMALNEEKRKVEQKYAKQLDSLRTEKDHEKNAAIRERLEPFFKESAQVDIDFFNKYPQSFITLFYLRFHVSSLSLQEQEGYYKRLGTKWQETAMGKELKKEIENLRAGSPGSLAKVFSGKDINGQPLNLADFKGKYVLLDFWASWCVPCRKGNPHLISLYRKYKDRGIEFISVSDDDRNHDAWRKAVEKDGIGMWKHILRGLRYDPEKGFDRTNDISEGFGIHTLPTKILIDPQGKIIGRYSSEEGPLDEMLASIFK